MDFYLNELSLHSQFISADLFEDSLKAVLNCKEVINKFDHNLYINYSLHQSRVSAELTFKDAVFKLENNLKRYVANWINKAGPFLDDNLHDGNFTFNNTNINGSSLAHAAFKNYNSSSTSELSFTPSNFNLSPLTVEWSTKTDKKSIDVLNFWGEDELQSFFAAQQPKIGSWESLLNYSKDNYTNLYFADNLLEILRPEPFSKAITERVMELLSVLNEFEGCLKNKNIERINEIRSNYFMGENACFTDESQGNKRKFKKELTFKHPEKQTRLFCPFHGKIKHLYFRIHFNWPKKTSEKLYIVYIGPKITKE
jgi:hypothetical protein